MSDLRAFRPLGLAVLNGKELPLIRNSLEGMEPSIGKASPRAQNERLHRARDEDLAG